MPLDGLDKLPRVLRAEHRPHAGEIPVAGEGELLGVVEGGEVEKAGAGDCALGAVKPTAGKVTDEPRPFHMHLCLIVTHPAGGDEPAGVGILLEALPQRVAQGAAVCGVADFVEPIDEEEGAVGGEQGAEVGLVGRERGGERRAVGGARVVAGEGL